MHFWPPFVVPRFLFLSRGAAQQQSAQWLLTDLSRSAGKNTKTDNFASKIMSLETKDW